MLATEKKNAVLGSIDNLNQAVSQALGLTVTFTVKEDSKGRINLISQPLDRSGIALFMFKEIRVATFGSLFFADDESIDAPKEVTCFPLHVSYSHQDGGTNGAALGAFGKELLVVLRASSRYGEADWAWGVEPQA